MEFKVEPIQGEERDGFYVQPLMKRIWKVQLDILKVINTICTQHNLKYYGWYGTLLGAVRHHGFIPWDDDMDLAMLREDYESFQHLSETELPEGWKILKVHPTLIRIVNTDSICLNQDFLDKYHGCPFIMGIDIFCLDHIPLKKGIEESWVNLFWAAINLYIHWDLFEQDTQWQKSKWEQLRNIERIAGYHFDKKNPIKEQLYVFTERTAAMHRNKKSNAVSHMSSLHGNRNYRIPISCFENIIEVPFETTTMPILADYDLLCKFSYGDNYMTPIRTSTHDDIKAQIHMLRDYFNKQGQNLPECFNMTFEE